MHWPPKAVRASAMPVDYLTDSRVGNVTFMQLKKFLKDGGVEQKELFAASTKFALISLAERKELSLEPLLAEFGAAPPAAAAQPAAAAPPAPEPSAAASAPVVREEKEKVAETGHHAQQALGRLRKSSIEEKQVEDTGHHAQQALAGLRKSKVGVRAAHPSLSAARALCAQRCPELARGCSQDGGPPSHRRPPSTNSPLLKFDRCTQF